MQRFLTREELLAEYTTPDDDPLVFIFGNIDGGFSFLS